MPNLKYIFFFFLFFIMAELLAHNRIAYIENKGQWHKNVLFKGDIPSGELYLEKNALTFSLWDSKKISDLYHGTLGRVSKEDSMIKSHAYQLQFLNANPNSRISHNSKSEEYFNYYLGNDQSKWASHCNAYEEIIYQDIYKHIDLKIYSMGLNVKYDFILHEGSNYGDIQIKYLGLDSVVIYPNQSLYGHHSLGVVNEVKPYAYVEKDGREITQICRYKLEGNILHFEFDNRPKLLNGERLVIDPVMIFSCYSGSTADNFGSTATYDENGNLYGSGTVFGAGYPTTLGAYQTAPNAGTGLNNPDIAITKFAPNGLTRFFSTYLGGTGCDQPHSLICDKNDRLIVFGTTSSTNFPTTATAYDTSFNGGPSFVVNGLGTNYANGADMFVAKFNFSGSALVASTYLGGSGTDGVNNSASLFHNYGDPMRGEVLLDSSDNIYIVSTTTSANFPTTLGSFDQTYNGGSDGCITKFNPTLTFLQFSSYIGGNGDDAIYSIALDKSDIPVIAGGTTSTDFPVTSNAWDQTANGLVDGFITKLKSTGDSLISSTYYGTPQYDQIYFVELTRKDTIHVFGQTKNNTNYFRFNAAYGQNNSGQFISKFGVLPDNRLMSTTVGRGDGDPDISPTAFLVDFCGKIYLAGWGSALFGFGQSPLTVNGLPITAGAFQSTTDNNDFYLMVLDDNASKLDYASFYGGGQSQEHVDGGTSRFDKNGVMYHAVCAGCGKHSDLPIVPAGCNSPTNNSNNCNLGVFKFDFGLPVKADFSANTGCAPTNITFVNLSHTIDPNPKYAWDFGDGGTSTAKNPVHFYSTSGVFNVRLILFDTLSCNSRDTIYKKVIVLQNGKNNLLPDKVICPGGTTRIGLDNVKDPTIGIKWVPTTGLDDTTILTPYATPSATTTYRLYITKNGCTDTFVQQVIFKLPDNLKITGDDLVCKKTNSVLIGTYFPKATYQWLPANLIVSASGNQATVSVPANNTKFVLLYRDSIGCPQKDSFYVNLLEPLIGLVADTLVCKDSVVLVTCKTNIAQVNYVWKPAPLIVQNNGSSVFFKVSNPGYYYLDAVDNSGCIVKDSIYINTVQNLFKINVDTLICKGDTIQIKGTNDPQLTYQWTPTNKIISGANTSNPLVKVNGKETFVVEVTDNSGCKVVDSVKIGTIDLIFKMNADTITCKDDTIKITCTSNPQFTYSWKPLSNVVSGGNTNQVDMIINKSDYYKIEIRDNSGCLFKDSIKINVIETYFKIYADTFLCIGDTTKITSTNNPQLTLSWRPLSHILTGANSSTLMVRVDTTRYFYVDITDNLGCKTKDSIKISTIENSFQLVYLDTLICLGDTFQILAPEDKDLIYSWSPIGNILSGWNTPKPKIIIDGKKSIYLQVFDTSGCFARDTVSFTPIQDILTLTTDTTKCDTDTLKVYTTQHPEFKYSWMPSNYIQSGATTSTPVFKIPQSLYIGLVITDNSGCKVRDSIFVNVRKTNIDILADTFICPNDTVDISAPVFAGAQYSWTPTTSIISGSNTHIAKTSVAKNTRFYVQILDTVYCNITDSVDIKTIDNENFNFINQDTSWCKGDTIRLNVTEIAGVNYNWNPNDAIIKGNLTAHPLALINQNTRFMVAITDQRKGCVAADTIDIKIDTNNIKISGKKEVCLFDTVQLRANFIKNAFYLWTPVNWLLNRDTMVNYFTTVDQTYKLVVTILPERECVYSDSIRVEVKNELTDLKVRSSQDSFNPGDKIQLEAIAQNGLSYLWKSDTTLSAYNIYNPIAKPDTTKWYYVQVGDFFGCKRNDSIEVIIRFETCEEPEIFIPNAFSPNGDKKNDVFYVRGDNISKLYLVVYDRWGQIIFETRDKNIGWDGSYGGNLMEPAAYAYYAEVNCFGGKTYFKKGNVTIVR